ncbi:hypothetical protein FRC09_006867 [Ceratobasidium sp. 395]|nr:hypothetical protein FRC09_006867 [Ceratobasidium sp. 395]
MRTSRLGFGTAASRIWRDLDDIEPLLKLLALTTEHTKVKTETLMKVTLPAFSPEIFTRFNCYSAFVQKLLVTNQWYIDKSDNTFCSFKLQPWSTLSLQAQRAPLLPNLESLKFAQLFSDENEVVLWISVLVSPSLKTLDLRGLRSTLSHLGTATVLGLLTQNTPNLKKISHHLTVVPSTDDTAFLEKSAASQLVLSPLARGHLQNSQHLVHLDIGGQFIDSTTFLELSRLPKLEHLSIEQLSNEDSSLAKIFNNIQLPANSFPSLQKLQLDFSVLDDIVAAWNVKPFVSGLTTVVLLYNTENPRVRTIYDNDVLNLILPIISASSPHITQLTLDSVESLGSEPLSKKLRNAPWTHMGRLSLSYLELNHFDADAASFKNVQQIWPHLVVLAIPTQTLTFQHLVYLSRLPKLEEILAHGLEDMGKVPETQCQCSSPLRTIEFDEMFNDWVGAESIENVARFLLKLWPELERVVCTDTSAKVKSELELLNTYIRVIQGVAKTKDKIAACYGPNAIQRLLHESLASF